MKILIIPDIHFGNKSFGKDFPDKINSRIQDQLYLLDHVHNIAVENNVDRMVILGDVFDKEHPEPILITLFLKWLTKCAEKFEIDIIMGNHDYKRVGNKIVSILHAIPAARIKNCQIISEIETRYFTNFSITYIPFTDRKELNIEKNIDATNCVVDQINKSIVGKAKHRIALGHMAIEKSLYIGGEISDEHNEIFVPISAFNHFDYTWMGHIHSPQILNKKPFVAHLGSIDKKTFKDGDKFVCIYDSHKNSFVDFKLPCRQLVDIAISIPKEIENISEYIKDEISKFNIGDAIVRIKVESENENAIFNRKDINQILSNMNVHHVAEISEKNAIEAIEAKIEIDESTDPYKAVDAFMNCIDVSDNQKGEISKTCKAIIGEVLS